MTIVPHPRLRTLTKLVVSAIMFCTAALTLVTVIQDGRPPQILASDIGSISVYVLLMVFAGYLIKACWKNEEAVEAGEASLWRVICTFFSAMAFAMLLGALAYALLFGR